MGHKLNYMNLESPKIIVNKSSEEIYNFLIEVKNFEKLMPEGISKFDLISNSEFLFALKGMPEITLVKKSETPFESVVLGSSGKLEFSLKASITSLDQTKSQIQLLFTGDFNPMMTMMIKGPISKFIENLVNNIQKHI